MSVAGRASWDRAPVTSISLTRNRAPQGFLVERLDNERVQRRLAVLQDLQQRSENPLAGYAEVQREALRLAGPEFMRTFRLDERARLLRQAYGGEFGQRCLLARRLVKRGVRFIEVSHNLNFINGTGWDVHNAGISTSTL